MSEPIRILLGETASKALLEAGECFLFIGKTTYRNSPNRMVIHCQPVPMDLACRACEVAMGQWKAGKRITTHPRQTPAPSTPRVKAASACEYGIASRAQ